MCTCTWYSLRWCSQGLTLRQASHARSCHRVRRVTLLLLMHVVLHAAVPFRLWHELIQLEWHHQTMQLRGAVCSKLKAGPVLCDGNKSGGDRAWRGRLCSDKHRAWYRYTCGCMVYTWLRHVLVLTEGRACTCTCMLGGLYVWHQQAVPPQVLYKTAAPCRWLRGQG